MTKALTTVTDSQVISALEVLKRSALESPVLLAPNHIRERNWICTPIESGNHLTLEDAENFAHACRNYGCQQTLAAATTDTGGAIDAYLTFPASVEGFSEFNEECWTFDFLLTTLDQAFEILCTKSDYILIAGPPEFVSLAVGGDISTSRSAFKAFAEQFAPLGRSASIDVGRELDRKRLLTLLELYSYP